MEQSTDQVFERLAGVEAAANQITENGALLKKEKLEAMEENMRQFDKTLELQTKERQEAMKRELDAEKDAELMFRKEETKRRLAAMEEQYEREHNSLAESIMQSIIRK